MTDRPEDPAETPIQRALRLKKAALEARNTPSGAREKPAKGMAAGASKPWMKR